MKTKITKRDYFIIQKMFNACLADQKNYLSKIYYNHEKKELFCSNGLIARVHKISFVEDAPTNNFSIEDKEFILTKAQFEKTYGKNVQTYDLEYTSLDDGNIGEIPNYDGLIWDVQNAYPREFLAMDLNNIIQFSKSFAGFDDCYFKLYFQKNEVGSILVYACDKSENNKFVENDPFQLVGIVTPVKIFHEENRSKFNIEKV